MDDFQTWLISFLQRIERQKNEDDDLLLIKEQFQSMEKRYHTWMNYYSLFNGALLVAYCTILVSTGEVIKEICGNETYTLKCTYWGFLFIIALLGIIASYCWYLSMIGHNKWLNNWRIKLQDEKPQIMRDISGENLESKFVQSCKKSVLPDFYSTAEITKVFILAVIVAWSTVLFYTMSKYIDYHVAPILIFLLGLAFAIFLYFLRFICFLCWGSNLSGFTINSKEIEAERWPYCKALSEYLTSSAWVIIGRFLVLLVVIILILVLVDLDCIKTLFDCFWKRITRC